MFALVKIVSTGKTIGINVDHVLRISPDANLTDSVLDLSKGDPIVVHGTPEYLTKNFNLNIVPSGAPSSQGSAAPPD